MSLTPMMKQYQAIRKTLSQDTVLFFRLGDFYEMFFDDAKRASAILDITLTARGGENSGKVPMCGIPFHASQGYINRLTRSGLKVAVCEQVEDPKLTKGIVKREVVRIISPATNLEDDTDSIDEHNFLAAVYKVKKIWGCAYLDLGTGDFKTGEFSSLKEIEDELIRLAPRECVVSSKADLSGLNYVFKENSIALTEYDDWIFEYGESRKKIFEQFNIQSIASLGIEDQTAGISCAGALLYYLKDNLHKSLSHLKKPAALQNTTFMFLDKQTIRNLELINPSSANRNSDTLYTILNRTVTPMGARLLGQYITRPLIDQKAITARLDAVEEFFSNKDILIKAGECLGRIKDLERLLARLNCGTPSARNIVALGVSLKSIPALKETLSSFKSRLVREQTENLHELKDLSDLIDRAFVELPPPGIRDGGFVRNNYSPDLDELRNISTNAKEWIADLQKKEMEKTGIKSLKIKFNKVFGYYIDVTRANLSMVPDYYIRKQTLVNSERFIIPELKEYEDKILGADEKSKEIEFRIYEEIRCAVLKHIFEIQKTAIAVGVLDVISSFAKTALTNNYCRPEVTEGQTIYITGSRHPVVEHTLEDESFVDNDVLLDIEENQLLLITGPNMAGKSTFIRQVALIVLMAQAGSFVPARMAKIGVVDRVFSRIGASDNLSRGESTFMVEMIETANILHNATTKSLLVFDEIGRGTSTFDGVSIAWSVCEYLNREKFHPKCLFATHYHELTELSDHHQGIKNFNVTVKELEDSILFLRKVIEGSADRSYGIHVGKLAGLPEEITRRAGEILLCLEEEKISDESIIEILKKKKGSSSVYDLPLFKPLKEDNKVTGSAPDETQLTAEESAVLNEISKIDANSMTPIEALTKIAAWKKELENSSEN
jgi:DNA mismatch repair protein MutS